MTAASTATDPRTAGAVLHAALPTRAQVHITRTKKFDHLAAQAFDLGWPVDKLAEHLGRGNLGDNPGAVITDRLASAATTLPPRQRTRGIPFCNRVQDVGPSAGMSCRELHGWIENDEGRAVAKCPCRTPPGDAA